MMMPEAFIEPWQEFEENDIKRNKILVACLSDLDINLIASMGPISYSLLLPVEVITFLLFAILSIFNCKVK